MQRKCLKVYSWTINRIGRHINVVIESFDLFFKLKIPSLKTVITLSLPVFTKNLHCCSVICKISASRLPECHSLSWSRYISERIGPLANMLILHLTAFLVATPCTHKLIRQLRLFYAYQRLTLKFVSPFFHPCIHCQFYPITTPSVAPFG